MSFTVKEIRASKKFKRPMLECCPKCGRIETDYEKTVSVGLNGGKNQFCNHPECGWNSMGVADFYCPFFVGVIA